MAENKDELTRWEYTSAPFCRNEKEEFNKLGREGWEAYGTKIDSSYSKEVLFKRPIIESRGRD